MGVGYDVLGGALDVAGDRVTVRKIDTPEVRIDAIHGAPVNLPTTADANTATAGLLHLRNDLDLPFGLAVAIEKGTPLSAGMGGSAASAVGAVVAANALLPEPLSRLEVLHYALLGEAVASGSIHPDNVAPSLYGGLVLTREVDPPDVVPLPPPEGVVCVLVHPHLEVKTKEARNCVPEAIPVGTAVRQSAHLGAFIAGCYRNDLRLLRRSLRDVMIEPFRANLVPGFAAVQTAAMDGGALGCTLAGAGPSLFAWAHEDDAEAIRDAMRGAFEARNVAADAWISPLDAPGARLVERPVSPDPPATDTNAADADSHG